MTLERKAKRSRLGFTLGLGGVMFALCAALTQQAATASPQPANPNIIRTRGIVIEDEQGRPRILLGAPAPTVAGRRRQDALTGLVYIDENGADRVTLGPDPQPMGAARVVPRRSGAHGAGIIIHDRDGVERGGYGVHDDGMAVLTLDWPRSGEGVALMSGNQFSGINFYRYNGDPRILSQAVMFGVDARDGTPYLSLNDSNRVQRMTFQLEGTSAPELISWNREGREVGRRRVE